VKELISSIHGYVLVHTDNKISIDKHSHMDRQMDRHTKTYRHKDRQTQKDRRTDRQDICYRPSYEFSVQFAVATVRTMQNQSDLSTRQISSSYNDK